MKKVRFYFKKDLVTKRKILTNGPKLVDSGESVENAIFREVKEELGIEIPKNQIKIYDIHKSNDKTKRFSYNFIFKVNYKINEYTLQKEEVSDVKYVTIEEMELAREKNDSMYTFCFWDKEDFENEIKKLKQIRKEISKT